MHRAHRFAWTLANGVIPTGMQLNHTCVDNRRCVNPAHLYLGTVQQNSDDMVRQGRSSRGERSVLSKLTEADVLSIRRRYQRTRQHAIALAAEYGVSLGCIYSVANRHSWRHVS